MAAPVTSMTDHWINGAAVAGSGERIDVVNPATGLAIAAVPAGTDEGQAVQIANSTIYGLAGAVFGEQDHALAVARRLRAGQVDVNGGSFNMSAPFGGYKQSGNGRELGRFGLEEFLEVKSIQR